MTKETPGTEAIVPTPPYRSMCGHSLVLAAWTLVVSLLLAPAATEPRGTAPANTPRPASFPHRIWEACDFEGTSPDYAWFGPAETNRIPRYPGNRTALGTGKRPYEKISAVMTGINPVPGPRMGKENGLFLRYLLQGTTTATFQHFSLTREDNWHVRVTDLATNVWSELAVNFTRDAKRNDGSAEPFSDGERMDDFKIFAGRPDQAGLCDLVIDDIIFFANDPALPPEPEPFPRRVIHLAAFDTGSKEKYWPGDYELAENPPAGAYWRAARAVPRKDGAGPFISLPIDPPRPVGGDTKLRFRYHLAGATEMMVQIFDATVQDNRHLRLRGLKQNAWSTIYLDLTRDTRRNDGTANSPLVAGNLVDGIFFFIEGEAARGAILHLDELVLFDASEKTN